MELLGSDALLGIEVFFRAIGDGTCQRLDVLVMRLLLQSMREFCSVGAEGRHEAPKCSHDADTGPFRSFMGIWLGQSSFEREKDGVTDTNVYVVVCIACG